jgi:hypothetical protein
MEKIVLDEKSIVIGNLSKLSHVNNEKLKEHVLSNYNEQNRASNDSFNYLYKVSFDPSKVQYFITDDKMINQYMLDKSKRFDTKSIDLEEVMTIFSKRLLFSLLQSSQEKSTIVSLLILS